MSNIFQYVIDQEAGFRKPVYLEEGWWWSFKEHVRRSFLLKNSQFTTFNEDRDRRPFKNIIRPVLNIQYRTEGFDVKDIEIFVENPESYYKSFLIRKYHVKWARENNLDTFIDDVVESYVDYGGALVKNVNGVRPEVVDLRSIAFCDQTDILSGPFAIKHYLSPDQLRDMTKLGWGTKNASTTVEDLILKAEHYKYQDKEGLKSETPGKYIEIYELHGTFSEKYLQGEDLKFSSQIHILGFYKDDKANRIGVTLFANREPTLPFKFLPRDKIYGRALGWGGVEELFESQIWTNFSEIQIIEMLEMASKTLFKTTDPRFKTRNSLFNYKQGQIFDLQEGTDLAQIDTAPKNLPAFQDREDRWELHANKLGAASEIMQGEQPVSGTPFKSVEAQLIEVSSLHFWRRGKLATFLDEIYRDWIIPHLGKQVVKGVKFLETLSTDELLEISKQVAESRTNRRIAELLFKGEVVFSEQRDILSQILQAEFLKGGKTRFLEILKGEMAGEKLNVLTNIAGKQKNMVLMTDKVVNLVRQFLATPQLRQDPELVRLLNTILESSGMSPILFSPRPELMGGGQAGPSQPSAGGVSPLRDLSASGKAPMAKQ